MIKRDWPRMAQEERMKRAVGQRGGQLLLVIEEGTAFPSPPPELHYILLLLLLAMVRSVGQSVG